MFPPDDFRLQITDARPDWKGRVKVGVIALFALFILATCVMGAGS